MIRFVKHVFGKAGERQIKLEQMAASWQGLTLSEIVLLPTYEGEAVGSQGAYLVFKPAALKANENTAGKITPETLSTAEIDDSAAEVSKGGE